MQKIAEFNRQRSSYSSATPIDLINRIATLRNERVLVTKKMFGLNELIYHCIIRDVGKIYIVESDMQLINLPIKMSNLNKSTASTNVIYFNDGTNEYSFNISKSVLYKRFFTSDITHEIDVDIVDNPYKLLKEAIGRRPVMKEVKEKDGFQHIFLPLYSLSKGIKYVPEKSGLNQWNADGRKRNENELYIRIPIEIHRKMPDFFPNRDVPFNLKLPDNTLLSAKVCQDNNKALMSNPNSDLGKWLLRHILDIKPGELVTYEKLSDLGIDSVIIGKIDNANYTIDFTTAGRYESFMEDGVQENE